MALKFDRRYPVINFKSSVMPTLMKEDSQKKQTVHISRSALGRAWNQKCSWKHVILKLALLYKCLALYQISDPKVTLIAKRTYQVYNSRSELQCFTGRSMNSNPFTVVLNCLTRGRSSLSESRKSQTHETLQLAPLKPQMQKIFLLKGLQPNISRMFSC